MKTFRFVFVLTLFAVGLGSAVRATLQSSAARRELAAAARQSADQREKVARAEQQLSASSEARTSLETELASVARARAGAEQQRRLQTEMQRRNETYRSKPFAAEIAVASNPQLGARYADGLRTSFALSYGGLFKAYGLPAEKIQAFTNLLVWLEMSRLDLIATEQAQKLDSDSSKKAWDDWFAMRRAKIADVLGEQAERFREYEKTENARALALRLASSEAYGQTAVTPAQVERVTEILAAHSARPATNNLVQKGTVKWSDAQRELQGVLSAEQIETLGYFVAEDAAQAQQQSLFRRATAKLKAGK